MVFNYTYTYVNMYILRKYYENNNSPTVISSQQKNMYDIFICLNLNSKYKLYIFIFYLYILTV